MNKTSFYVGRGAEVLVGLIFLVAAVLKALDVNLFIGQILAYQIFVTPGALKIVAFATLALEAFLGLSLLLGSPWRKAVLALSAAMLVFFSGLIVYAWQVHGLEDCGCFGSVSFTPPQALAKNGVFLVLIGVAWYFLVQRPQTEAGEPGKRGLRIALPALLALLLCGIALPQLGGGRAQSTPVAPPVAGETSGGGEGVAATEPDENDETPATAGPSAQQSGEGVFHDYTVTTDWGETLNLGEGEYLIALLSMTCDHCMESVPHLNSLMAEASLPRLVAVCLEPEAGSLSVFQGMTGPQFPMASVGNDMLEWARICKGTPPRLCYVRNGVVEAGWNDEMPEYQTILEAMAASGGAETE